MPTRVPATREVLQWARKRVRLTVEQAAKKLKRTIEEFEKIESGELLPNAGTFRAMARLYEVSEADLLSAAPPPDRDLPNDFRTFDGIKPALSYETVAAIRRAQHRLDILSELVEDAPELRRPPLPRITIRSIPEEHGAAERNRFGFDIQKQLEFRPEAMLMRFRVLIEERGIAVFFDDFPIEDARGVSLFESGMAGILVNKKDTAPGARLFTLMHEYCHVLLGQVGISDLRSGNPVESFCNKFAAAFLMPDEALRRVFDLPDNRVFAPTISELSRASGQLCVSISALALRLQDAGYAPKGYYGKVIATLAKPAPKNRKPQDGGPPVRYLRLQEYGHRYAEAVLANVEKQVISPLEGSRLLDVAPFRLQEIEATIAERRRPATHVD